MSDWGTALLIVACEGAIVLMVVAPAALYLWGYRRARRDG